MGLLLALLPLSALRPECVLRRGVLHTCTAARLAGAVLGGRQAGGGEGSVVGLARQHGDLRGSALRRAGVRRPEHCTFLTLSKARGLLLA